VDLVACTRESSNKKCGTKEVKRRWKLQSRNSTLKVNRYACFGERLHAFLLLVVVEAGCQRICFLTMVNCCTHGQGHKEWLAEVHFLGLVDNPYLVKLIGYCTDDDETGTEGGIQRLLVYEFMPKRGLDNHLFVKGPHIIPWHIRVQIALGAARGLAYLHEELEFQVSTYHGRLHPSSTD
jgi:hypothetical protein